MRFSSLLPVSTALLLALSACSSEPASPSFSDFYGQYLAAAGTVAVCELGFAPEYALARVRNEDRIHLLPDASKAISSGRVKFDSAKAQSCLRQLQTPSTCWGAAVQALPSMAATADCATLLQGAIAAGGACYSPQDCVSGQCATCPSTCGAATVLAEGADCSGRNVACPQGTKCELAEGDTSKCVRNGAMYSYCSSNHDCASGLACVRGFGGHGPPLCSTPIAAGAGCLILDTGNSCASGLWCQPSSSGSSDGTCAAQVDAGATCTSVQSLLVGIASPQCKGNQICAGLVLDSNGGVTTPGHCDVPHDVGGACTATGSSATQGCYYGLVCDGTNHCAALPKAGSPCVLRLGTRVCDPAAWCDNAGNCQALKSDGSACASYKECASEFCPSTGLCTTKAVCDGP